MEQVTSNATDAGMELSPVCGTGVTELDQVAAEGGKIFNSKAHRKKAKMVCITLPRKKSG